MNRILHGTWRSLLLGGFTASPRSIVSITDDGNGKALVTLAANATGVLADGTYVVLPAPYGFRQAAVQSATTFLAGDYVSDVTGGTWAAAHQTVDTFTTDQMLDTSAWVGVADFAATARGGDGDATTGGGGAAYAGGRLTAPFPATLTLAFTSGTPSLTASGKQLTPAAGANGASGGAGGLAGACVTTGFSSAVTHSGGNGGTNVGGGGGAGTADGDGQPGQDGPDEATAGAGGNDGSGNQSGGAGAIGSGADDGDGPGAGAGASDTLPGTGAAGQLVVRHYELA